MNGWRYVDVVRGEVWRAPYDRIKGTGSGFEVQ